jgi:hypothetical protein
MRELSRFWKMDYSIRTLPLMVCYSDCRMKLWVPEVSVSWERPEIHPFLRLWGWWWTFIFSDSLADHSHAKWNSWYSLLIWEQFIG